MSNTFDDYVASGLDWIQSHISLQHGEKLSEEELKKRNYAFPETRKFPLPDKDHVRSAIRFFNYVEEENEEILAKAILKRMKELGITFNDISVGVENRFNKYINPKKDQK